MKTLPTHVQEKMQPRLKVIWWGRRAFAECVSEISEGIFWIYIVSGLAWNVARWTDLDEVWTYWLGVSIVMAIAFQHAFLEIMAWQNEIYVVARDEVNGGGRLYKFWGWLNRRYIEEAITVQSPSILPDQAWYFRLWGWVTGEEMVRVKLASVNHTYIEGKKISPKFENAIKFIRGYKPPKEDLPATSLANLGYLNDALVTGLISDPAFVENAAKALILRNVYSE